MGANDDREMLEVAKEEVGRLEREVETEKRSAALAEKHWRRDQADLAIVVGQRDAALAMIERVLNLTCGPGPEARRILTQSPTDALAEHDRTVRAEALDEAADDLPFIDRPRNLIVRQQGAAHWLRDLADKIRAGN